MGEVVAVVPLRDGRSGKTRLAGVLGPEARTRLVGVLARHVAATLLDVEPVDRVLVLTQDPDFAGGVVPPGPRLRVVRQAPDRPGLNGAARQGLELARTYGAGRVLLIHADLPLLDGEDVRALLAPAGRIVLATDRTHEGTNALVLDTALDYAFRFGPGSRALHREEAERLGQAVVEVDRSGTAIDLDSPADWAALPGEVRDRVVAAVGLAHR